MRAPTLALAATTVALSLACGQPLAESRDVSGNYEVIYADDLRVYINGELVAEALPGENPTIEWNGSSFELEAVCGDEGTVCPSEAYWARMGVEQPWGTSNRLLNFISLDTATAGTRMGGLLDDAGHFVMLAGLDVGGNEACAALGVGTVEGDFTPGNDGILNGVFAVEWGAGCVIGDVVINGTLRLETSVEAVRTGPLDLGGITPEPPIDEDGEEIDPAVPEDG